MENNAGNTNEQIVELVAKLSNKVDAQTAQFDTLVTSVDSIMKERRPLRDLFKSKKAIATIMGLLVTLLEGVGLDIPQDTLVAVVGLIAVYVVGQGVADHGKEKEKVRIQYQASFKPISGQRQSG
ncbi:MAG: hypothetical protein F4X61_03110 [Rhodothermaceae bacterium]|nr:hypothetical protein [Rhodothermaceae bacterium]